MGKNAAALIVDVIFSTFLKSRPHLIWFVHIRYLSTTHAASCIRPYMRSRHQSVLCTTISSNETLSLVCSWSRKIEDEDGGKRSRKRTQNRDSQTEIGRFLSYRKISFDDSFHFFCVGDWAAAAKFHCEFYGVFDFTMALPYEEARKNRWQHMIIQHHSTSSPLINVFNASTVAGSIARKSMWTSPVFEFSNDGSHSFIMVATLNIISSAEKKIELKWIALISVLRQKWLIFVAINKSRYECNYK